MDQSGGASLSRFSLRPEANLVVLLPCPELCPSPWKSAPMAR